MNYGQTLCLVVLDSQWHNNTADFGSVPFFVQIIFTNMASYASIFGETLLSKNGPVDVATLNDKYVAVYFSYFH
jgi:hypothetical protein